MNKPLQTSLLDEAMEEIASPIASAPVAPAQEPRPWSADDPDIAVHAQPALRVYENRYGGIVIAQEATLGEDDDPFIVCRPENLALLIARLRRYLPK
jgi:hypothetical protein